MSPIGTLVHGIVCWWADIERHDPRREQVVAETTLVSIGIDREDAVAMVAPMEDDFGILISDEVAGAWITVGDVIKTVEEEVAAFRQRRTGPPARVLP